MKLTTLNKVQTGMDCALLENANHQCRIQKLSNRLTGTTGALGFKPAGSGPIGFAPLAPGV